MEFKAIMFVVIAAGGILSGLSYVITRTIRRHRAEKRLTDGLANVADGEVATVVGTVRPVGEPLIAPVSGKSCVAYDARVRIHSPYSSEPDAIRRVAIPFELQTTSGIVRVEAESAELLFDVVPLIPRRIEHEAKFAQACGLTAPMSEVNCTEVCVEIGAKVAVHGVVQLEIAPQSAEAGYRHAGTRIRIGAHPEHALTIGAPR